MIMIRTEPRSRYSMFTTNVRKCLFFVGCAALLLYILLANDDNTSLDSAVLSSSRHPSPELATTGIIENQQSKVHSKTSVQIFLVSYNDVILEATVEHYRLMFGCEAVIVLLDNGSNENFIARAMRLGLSIHPWGAGDAFKSEDAQTDVKNHVWKSCRRNGTDWVVVADIDEWLFITADELATETAAGTTILRTYGFEVVADSRSELLDDIPLHPPQAVMRGYYRQRMDKTVCFNPRSITEIQYGSGCHISHPIGNVRFSVRPYVLAHMSILGLPYLTAKNRRSVARRSPRDFERGMNIHYLEDSTRVEAWYAKAKVWATQSFVMSNSTDRTCVGANCVGLGRIIGKVLPNTHMENQIPAQSESPTLRVPMRTKNKKNKHA